MKKAISLFLSLTALSLCFCANVLAEPLEQGSDENSRMVFVVIAAALAVAAVISVILVNKKTKEYRQAFKRRRNKK